MPNTRRRRFSVQNKIGGSSPSNVQNETTNSRKINPENVRNLKQRRKFSPNVATHVNNNTLEIVTECDSAPSMETKTSIKKQYDDEAITMDKDVTASSSNIDFFNILHATDQVSIQSSKETVSTKDSNKTDNEKQVHKNRIPLKKDVIPRQHRVKVRSPKRSMVILDTKEPEGNIDNVLPEVVINTPVIKESHRSIAVDAINWSKEIEENSVPEVVTNVVEVGDDIRESEHSLDDMCRICHGGEALSTELGQLISACSCRGTVARVHVKCLERWLTESGKSRCELCGTRYVTRRVHRYGVPRALVMWILSQNAKQLMVDSLGIMLMSPLAVLAAWLSGRTLAGLMTQESHVTPWPLASTFVLACMTLSRPHGHLAETWLDCDVTYVTPWPLASTFILACMAVLFWRPDYLAEPWLAWEGIYITSWPLVSTFVLACMTLVCYYCWIVSAATRHALSWWIWYRSQYEVRLQLQESDE